MYDKKKLSSTELYLKSERSEHCFNFDVFFEKVLQSVKMSKLKQSSLRLLLRYNSVEDKFFVGNDSGPIFSGMRSWSDRICADDFDESGFYEEKFQTLFGQKSKVWQITSIFFVGMCIIIDTLHDFTPIYLYRVALHSTCQFPKAPHLRIVLKLHEINRNVKQFKCCCW